MSLRLRVFQHVAHERPANVALWAKSRGHEVHMTYVTCSESLPEPDAYDALVVLGGPMGVYEESHYPWMTREKRAIEKAIEADKKVLGICLGSQLIASVLGARVYKHSCREIGWFPVRYNEAAHRMHCFSHFPVESPTFHWHMDTFELPKSATLLASSDATPHQAFACGPDVIGLQFHPEIARHDIEAWIGATPPEELRESSYIQTPDAMLKEKEHLSTVKSQLDMFLDRWLAV